MTDQAFDIDLTDCDREPIHQLGAIQPIGFLVALDPDWTVVRASTNVDRFLGVSATDLIGKSFADHVDDETLHALRNRLTLLRGGDAIERQFGLPLHAGGPGFDFALHLVDGAVVIEAEPSDSDDAGDAAGLIRSMMSRLDAADSAQAFHREGARQIRALTGFDRVMVYRFDEDGSGLVVAEAVRAGFDQFMGLRYPASDIPQQARALYVRNPFRIIADVEAQPVSIVASPAADGKPLDLSLSVLRSVSPVHLQYLRNMGVGASMSISIVVEGRLWGLFACHHYAARCPGFERRSVAELFGQMFAMKLESRERKAETLYETTARATGDRLLSAIANDATLLDNPEWVANTIAEAVPCDGVGIWIDGRVAASGSTPPAEAFARIVARLNATASGKVFATDAISELVPEAVDYLDRAAGMLAIPLSRSPRDYVLLFRQERLRTITWAGHPDKPVKIDPITNVHRLSPRASFAAWRQEVHGRSEPFNAVEVRVAEMLRVSLIEVVLRLSDDAQEERRRASERQELLIAELNHRVRNILSLIRGLVRQSRSPDVDPRDYIRQLEGRIEALARAHDQITQDNWGPASLARLIETEASAYFGDDASRRLILDGPPVSMTPQGFSTVALVLHELVTNSAKYGGLSDSGRVTVSWHVAETGELNIAWRESGGPPVKAPTRQGFGTTIIQQSIPYDLGGKAEVRYVLTGLEADFCIPSRHIVAGAAAAAIEAARPAVAAKNQAPSATTVSGAVLLVEDSLIIAMDAEDILVRLGASSVATAASVRQAMAEFDRPNGFTLAVLDVNLGNETSLPIADHLRALGVPYVFATGYGEQLKLPPAHAAAPVIQKPYTLEGVARVLATMQG